jgi:HK97 gp10 family phage protein
VPFTFDNLDAFAKDFERAVGRLAERADKAFVALADDIAARANGDAHPSAFADISVHDVKGRKSHVIDVGPPVGSFPLVFWEFGTRNNPATPFIRPAINELWASWEPW